MRETLLIAWREYKQYVLSRGFLLLLLLAPLGIFGFALLFGFMQKSIPQRSYVIIDQTNQYADQVENYLGFLHDRNVLAAWDQFVTFNGTTSFSEDSPIKAPFAPAAITRQRVIAFKAEGGLPAARQVAAPYLRTDPSIFEEPKRKYLRRDLPLSIPTSANTNEIIEQLRPFLLGEKNLDEEGNNLFALLVVPQEFGKDNGKPAEYWGRNLVDVDLRDSLEAALTQINRYETASDLGLSEHEYETIRSTRAIVDVFRPDREIEDAALNIRDTIETGLPAFMTYVLFILIFSVGSLLLTNTIEERSNKIVEMLLSSVTANQLMLGKLIGIGAVGLTIPAIGGTFAIIGAFTLFAQNEIAREIISSLLFSPLVWVYLFYFLCGYVIFAMLYLAIGAVSNSLQDAQTYLGPVTLVVMAPLPLMVLVFQDPNGLVASIMTWIPIYTPYAVMIRAASDPPIWEIIGATVFMLVFGAFFVSVMGRIFRRGLLNDSPSNLKGLLRLATGKS